MDAFEGNLDFHSKTNGTDSDHGLVSDRSNGLAIKTEFIPDLVVKEERRVSPDRDETHETNFVEQSNFFLNTDSELQEPDQLFGSITGTVSHQCDAIKPDDASPPKVIKLKPTVEDDRNDATKTTTCCGDIELTNDDSHERTLNGSHQQPKVGQSQTHIILKEARVVLKKLTPEELKAIISEQANLGCARICSSGKLKEYTQEKLPVRDLCECNSQNKNYFEAVAESTSKQCYCPFCAMNYNVTYQHFSCPHCSEKFKYRSWYESHLRRHSGELHQCAESYTKCNPHSSKQTHFRSHAEPLLSCAYCPRQFDRKRSLIVHLRTHEVRPYACMICALKFRNNLHLRRHLERVHSDKLVFYPSRPCPARFKGENMLQYRLVDHTTGRRFSCDKCTRKFKLEKSFQKHMMTHSKLSRFQQTDCYSSFEKPSTHHMERRANDLSETISIGKRQCSHKKIFTRLFHSNPLCQRNERNVGIDENRFPCDKCKVEFDDDVDESIICEGGCYGRFHLQCAGLREDDFETIILLKGKVFWICESCVNCRTESMGLHEEKIEMKSKLDSVQTDVERFILEQKYFETDKESFKKENTEAYVENVKEEARRLFRVLMEIKADLENVKAGKVRLLSENSELMANLKSTRVEAERLLSEKMAMVANLENLKAEKGRLLSENSELTANLNDTKVKVERLLSEKMEMVAILENVKVEKDRVLFENSELMASLNNTKVEVERLVSEKMEMVTNLENVKAEKDRLLFEKLELTENLKNEKTKADRLFSEKTQVAVNLEIMKTENGKLLLENSKVTENLKNVKEEAENLQKEKTEVNTELQIVKAEKRRLSCEMLRNTDLQQDCEEIREDLGVQADNINEIPKNMSEREVRPVVWFIGDNYKTVMDKLMREEVWREGYVCKVQIDSKRNAISWGHFIDNSVKKGCIVDGDVIVYFAGRMEVGRKESEVLVSGVERILQMVGPRIKVMFVSITHRYNYFEDSSMNRMIDFCNSEVRKKIAAASNGLYIDLSYLVREDFEWPGEYLNEIGKRQFVYAVVSNLRNSGNAVASNVN